MMLDINSIFDRYPAKSTIFKMSGSERLSDREAIIHFTRSTATREEMKITEDFVSILSHFISF